MAHSENTSSGNQESIIKEIIGLEREYFFGKRHFKTERRRKLREIIERHTKAGDAEDDSETNPT